jgi:hypothetical protein
MTMKPVVLPEPYHLVRGYFVTDCGKVWSEKSRKFLKPSITPNGYPVVGLSVGDRKARVFFVHRLVVDAFLPSDPNRSITNHKNGDKTDNRLENLERCNHSENLIHAHAYLPRKRVIGSSHPSAKINEQIVLEARLRWGSGDTMRSMAREYGIGYHSLRQAIHGETWKHVE